MCDKGFIWNPCNCECQCDKLCDAGEYLDYKKFKYRKRMIDKLVEECREIIGEKELHSNDTLNAVSLNGILCSFCTVYIVLFVIFLKIGESISSVFIYLYWHLKKIYTETTIYWV